MKLIQAMKKLKDIQRKATDLRRKVKDHCADLDFETALYPDQAAVISGWLQAHKDLQSEYLRLKVAIQKTNLATQVTIDLGNGVVVTRSISEWIIRRKECSQTELAAWAALTDRGLKEGTVQQSTGVAREVRIRRYYNPSQRDSMMSMFQSEPTTIDGNLEVVNAVTDLIE